MYWALRYIGVDPDVAYSEAAIRLPEAALGWASVVNVRSMEGVRPGLALSKLRAGATAPDVAPESLRLFRERVLAYRAKRLREFWSQHAAGLVVSVLTLEEDGDR